MEMQSTGLTVFKKLLFPVKAVTFVWRFLVLFFWTAYLEGNREG